MGHEYRIAWKPTDVGAAKAWLQRRGGKLVVFRDQERFEFRFGGVADSSKMPDALVSLEKDGIYFCDFSRSDQSAAIFRGLIDEALVHSDLSDSVVVHSL